MTNDNRWLYWLSIGGHMNYIIRFEYFSVDCEYTHKEFKNQVEENLDINDIFMTEYHETTCDGVKVSIFKVTNFFDKLDNVQDMCLRWIYENKR